MNLKLGQVNEKSVRRLRNNNKMCIACGRKCSMSGLCMMHWPGFPVAGLKEVVDSGEGYQKGTKKD